MRVSHQHINTKQIKKVSWILSCKENGVFNELDNSVADSVSTNTHC